MNSYATEKQLEALAQVQLLTTRLGYPPSMRELADVLGIAASSAYRRLRGLRRLGLLEWEPGKGRTMRVKGKSDGN